MYNFFVSRQPPTFNSWKKTWTGPAKGQYRYALYMALLKYFPEYVKLDGELYFLIVHFYKVEARIDADNISKPHLDCMTKLMFDDDFDVKIRTAYSFNLNTRAMTLFDYTGFDPDLLVDLLDSCDNENHTVYLEVGRLKDSMFKLNLEVK